MLGWTAQEWVGKVTYADESAGVVHRLLLLNLLQQSSLDVLIGLGGGSTTEERHFVFVVIEVRELNTDVWKEGEGRA